MLEQLEERRAKLYNRAGLLENIAGFSLVFSLIMIGAIFGSFPNKNCDNKMLRFSLFSFGLSAISLAISSKLYEKNEKELDANFWERYKITNTPTQCWGCIYSSGNKLLPCAIHPMVQSEDCADKDCGISSN